MRYHFGKNSIFSQKLSQCIAIKEFEISLPKAVYFGEYLIENGKLHISDVHTFDDDEQRVEIDSLNDAELFNRIHRLLTAEKVDEIEAEIEEKIIAKKEMEAEKETKIESKKKKVAENKKLFDFE